MDPPLHGASRSLPPSTPNEKDGFLRASILSVYDLPYKQTPQSVSLFLKGNESIQASTGPPLAKHKDRNSFRFSPNTNDNGNSASSDQSNEVTLVAPLPILYSAKLGVRVTYENNPNRTLESEYDLNQLFITQNKWVILSLKDNSNTTAITNSTEETVEPTIRIKFFLSGPYRLEIGALLGLANTWFGLVDGMEDNVKQVWNVVPKLPFDPVYLSIPTVPLITILVVASPILAGLIMVGVPLLLPIVLTVLALSGGLILSGGFVYSSSKAGRSSIGGICQPVAEGFLSTKAGQKLVYNTGPRPTPVSVAKIVLPNTIWAKLVTSLLIDLIGSSSYLLPVVGEALDIGWAPIQTILIMAMYDPTTPTLKYVSFVEEILPFTDVVPTATIGWAFQFVLPQLFNQRDLESLVQTALKVRSVSPEHTTVPNRPTTSTTSIRSS